MVMGYEEDRATGSRTWAIVEGILLVLIGLVAIGAPLVTAAATAMLLPVLLIIAGIVQLVTAFRGRSGGTALWHILLGIVAIVAGVAIFAQPSIAIATLPLLVVGWLVVDGIIRLIAAASAPRGWPGRTWMAITGVVGLILAAMLWLAPFGQTLLIIGMFIGIDILFAGIALLAGGFSYGHRYAPTA